MLSTNRACRPPRARRTAGPGCRRDLGDVARLRQGDGQVAGREVVDVVVAGEAADLALSFGLGHLVDGGLDGLGRRRRPGRRRCDSMNRPRVSRISREQRLGPRTRGEQVVDAVISLPVAGGCRRSGHAGQPRGACTSARVEGRRRAGRRRRFALFGMLASSNCSSQPRLISRATMQSVTDRRGRRRCPGPRQRFPDLGEVLVVVVDVLGVVDTRCPSRPRRPATISSSM